MSEYICNAQLRFSGKDYAIGEKIPDGVVMPKRAKALIASGHLTELTEATNNNALNPTSNELLDDTLINIPINTDNGPIQLKMSSQSVISSLTIVQLTVDAANEAVKKVQDDDVLILLHAIERRKGVLKVIEEQHATLAAQTGGDAVGENV